MTFSDGILEILPGKDLLAKEQTLLQLLTETDGSLEAVVARLGISEIKDTPDDIAVLSISRGYTPTA